MTVDHWRETLDRTHGVVLEYAGIEFERLARTAIWQLQRIGASGIFGDDFSFKTMWDEYCHEVQNGPFLEEEFEMLIDAVIDAAIEKLPMHVKIMLSIAALFHSDEYDDPSLIGTIALDSLRQAVKTALGPFAGSRCLDRFVEDF